MSSGVKKSQFPSRHLRNTRTRYEMRSKLTIVFIVNFEHITRPALVFLLLTLTRLLSVVLQLLTFLKSNQEVRII